VPFLQACKRGIRRTKIIAVCLRYGVTDIHTNDKRISTYRGNNDVCLAGKLFDKRGIGVRADNRVNPKLLEFFCLFGIPHEYGELEHISMGMGQEACEN
jgi:hypothetical protein